jgi:chromosome segregation ATPase
MNEMVEEFDGLDPETSTHVAEEAARLGVPVAEYLNSLLSALAEQPAADAEVEASDEADAAPFAVGHRLEVIERRVASSVSGLGANVRALDLALDALTARVDDAGALAEDTAETVNVALQEIRASVATLRKRIGDAETDADTTEQANEIAHRGIEARIATAEAAIERAHVYASEVADGQVLIRRSVSDDLRALSDDVQRRLDIAVDESRAAAEIAADRTDAAVAHLMRELRVLREANEARIAESVEQTRLKMHASVKDVSARLDTVALRVAENASAASRTLEEVTHRLSESENAVRAQFAAASEAWDKREDIVRSEIAELREAHQTNLTRAKLTDVAISNLVGEIAAIGETVDRRVGKAQVRQEQLLSEVTTRISAAETRASQAQQEAAQAKRTLSADIERVESCTLAALEKLAADISASRESNARALAELKARHDGDIQAAKEASANTASRLNSLDAALAAVTDKLSPMGDRLGTLESAHGGFEQMAERLLRLEHIVARGDADKNIAVLRRAVDALNARFESHAPVAAAVQRVEERLVQRERDARDAATRIKDVADVLSQFTAQSADAAVQSDERLQRLEAAVLDWRSGETVSNEALSQLNIARQRLAEIERQQAAAMDSLRGQVEEFARANDRRLTVLETIAESSPTAPNRDLSREFDIFRSLWEDRVQALESRSMRALEQVGETLAMLERREDAVARSA